MVDLANFIASPATDVQKSKFYRYVALQPLPPGDHVRYFTAQDMGNATTLIEFDRTPMFATGFRVATVRVDLSKSVSVVISSRVDVAGFDAYASTMHDEWRISSSGDPRYLRDLMPSSHLRSGPKYS